jgi:UDP-N-acetylmuramoylalanine--D-glutamate ligase
MPGSIELRKMRVLVVGLGKTGVATSLFCAGRNAKVTATDARAESELGEVPAKLRAAGVTLELGGHKEKTFCEQDLIVPSPGVAADDPFLAAARAKKITIWSEIELAYRFLEGRLIGITGSNGKTTTTTLVHHILKSAGEETILAGNVGTPLISYVDAMNSGTISVVELSSFQLELIEKFRANIGVLLNLTPDHLDRHKSMEAYGAAKARMFENQTEMDAAVLNADDAASLKYAPGKPQVFWFGGKKVARGTYLRGEEIVFVQKDKEEAVMRVAEIPLPGAHNVENVMAAVTTARLAGVNAEKVASAVRSFAGVEHRLEFVAEIRGVRYYNDSKATNVDATLKALNAFAGRVLIILGGKDKGSDYMALQQALREKAILALLIGVAAEKIESQIGGSVRIEHAGTMERAVKKAAKAAQAGDIVLLAPACASFDQFENYEHRGRVFKDLVREMAQAPGISTADSGTR